MHAAEGNGSFLTMSSLSRLHKQTSYACFSYSNEEPKSSFQSKGASICNKERKRSWYTASKYHDVDDLMDEPVFSSLPRHDANLRRLKKQASALEMDNHENPAIPACKGE
ncbi:unnamed protein product [Clonostachys chloroleuca]|uniref:Uncharacterized protein n=1 Tax=Clonostachys chloroleuca TaxID=1926264 RepID=A0AA35M2K7_9HYPO|nr:unnamed protein product [Clonostachys chloroleuca]